MERTSAAADRTSADRVSADRVDRGALVEDQHRYSDPIFYPLRGRVFIACVRTTCSKSGRTIHGEWAIDWSMGPRDKGLWTDIGVDTADVYAAGGGQVHILRNEHSCSDGGERPDTGTILAIDHGGGVMSLYKHMDHFAPGIAEGVWVNPRDVLGKIGTWGSGLCHIPYLHFEVKRFDGTVANPPFNEMFVCHKGVQKVWPRDIPNKYPGDSYETWDDTTTYSDIPSRIEQDYLIPATTSRCFPTWDTAPYFDTPSRPPRMAVAFTGTTVTLTWRRPAGDPAPTEIVLRNQQRHTVGYDEGTYIAFPVNADGNPLDPATGAPICDARTCTYTVTGLEEDKDYRFTVAVRAGLARGGEGASEWSPAADVHTGRHPEAPPIKGTSSTYTTVGFSWARPVLHGYPPTGYTISIRTVIDGVRSAWSNHAVPVSTSYRWEGMMPDTEYQMRVRADTALGAGPWSRIASIATLTPQPPDAPEVKGTSWTSTSVSLAWARALAHDFPATGYQVALRPKEGTSWGSWTTTDVPISTSFRWDGLRSRRSYQAKVRAFSDAGTSDWSATVTITTN